MDIKNNLKFHRKKISVTNEFFYKIILFLFIVLFVRKFLQFSSGLQFPTWGYSTFLVNYEGGFVRRGFSGQLLMEIYKITSITPYTVLFYFFLFLFIFLISSWYQIIKNFEIKQRVFLLLNPAFVAMPLQQDTSLLVKEWIIGAILLVNTLLAIKTAKQKISAEFFDIYFKFIVIPVTFVLNLVHEEQFFLLPIYIFLYLIAMNIKSPYNHRRLLKCLTLRLFTLTQIVSLIFVIYFHGNILQANKIFYSLPQDFQAKKYIIDSVGWSLKDSFGLTLNLWKSPATLFTFLICLIIGPISIYLILNRFNRKFIVRDLLIVSPVIFLFVVGWDWGRWIILLTFASISLSLLNSRLDSSISQNLDRPNKIRISLVASLFAILLLMISVRVPNCCVQPWYGFTTFDQIVQNVMELKKFNF